MSNLCRNSCLWLSVISGICTPSHYVPIIIVFSKMLHKHTVSFQFTFQFQLSHTRGTYNIPYLHKEPKKVFQLYVKLTKPIANVMLAIVLGQMLLASAVTHFEAKSINTVKKKLSELEYNLEHNIEATYDF